MKLATTLTRCASTLTSHSSKLAQVATKPHVSPSKRAQLSATSASIASRRDLSQSAQFVSDQKSSSTASCGPRLSLRESTDQKMEQARSLRISLRSWRLHARGRIKKLLSKCCLTGFLRRSHSISSTVILVDSKTVKKLSWPRS